MANKLEQPSNEVKSDEEYKDTRVLILKEPYTYHAPTLLFQETDIRDPDILQTLERFDQVFKETRETLQEKHGVTIQHQIYPNKKAKSYLTGWEYFGGRGHPAIIKEHARVVAQALGIRLFFESDPEDQKIYKPVMIGKNASLKWRS
ncbi:MAG: hypothetical protein JW922_01790 [Paludibacteraceae bacterium]|nr:hypothetical protein [Paludibacteraceae bacterium]